MVCVIGMLMTIWYALAEVASIGVVLLMQLIRMVLVLVEKL